MEYKFDPDLENEILIKNFDQILKNVNIIPSFLKNSTTSEKMTLSGIASKGLDVTEILKTHFPQIGKSELQVQLTQNIDSGYLFFPRNDSIIAPTIRNTGKWEASESTWIKNNIFPGSTFLNLGAHVGYHSFLAAKFTNPRNIFAVEPNPNLIPILQANIWLNHLDINVIEKAVGLSSEKVDFFQDFNNTGDGRVQKFKNSRYIGRVDVIDIKTLFEIVPTPDFTLMDIQGSELTLIESIFENSSSKCKVLFEFTPLAISVNLSTAIHELREKTSKFQLSFVDFHLDIPFEFETLDRIIRTKNVENINLVAERREARP
jgi:FkbM family methyltransferase